MIDFKVTFQEEKPIQVDFFDEASSKNTEFGETQTINIGRPGDSAYDVAVQNGFVGTQEEWLWSLKGEVGPQGIQGPQGEQGAPGKDGKDGADGADGYTPVKGTDYFTESDKQEIAEQAAQLVDIPESGVTSWNDLKDKPFGVGTTEWKQIASRKDTSVINSATSISVIDLTLSVELGRKYRIVFRDYNYNLTKIEATVIATQASSVVGEYISLGTAEDDVCAYQLRAGMPWSFNFKNPISFPVGYDLIIYEAVETITTLDEKFLPNTIARVEDIPKVPTKLSELENDAGFITADEVPEPVTSWNDLTNKPFGEESLFDIQWDGDTSGRFVLDMSKLGYDDGVYFVKVSDFVPSTEDVIGGKITNNSGEVGSITEEYIDNSMFPGAYVIDSIVTVVYEQNSVNSAFGLPDGYITNGTYFLLWGDGFVSSFRSTVVVKIDEKYIPDTIAMVDDVPTKLSELENDAGFITADEIPDSVTSWNDLEDKPFYERVVENEVLVEDGLTVTTGTNLRGSVRFQSVQLSEGAIYKISITGYSSITGGNATIETTAMATSSYKLDNFQNPNWVMEPDIAGTGSCSLFFPNVEGFTTCTLRIVELGTELKTLDEKYLPETAATKTYVDEAIDSLPEHTWESLPDKPFGDGPNKWVGAASCNIASATQADDGSYTTSVDMSFNPTPGNEYRIDIKDRLWPMLLISHKCICEIVSDPVTMSSTYSLGVSGDPVSMRKIIRSGQDFTPWIFTFQNVVSSNGYRVEIYEATPTIIPLGEKYLPDSVVLESELEARGYQTESQVTALINNALGVIENGTY